MGSLVSALASFLDAKVHQGEWLIRMEDIDPPREEAGAKDKILQALEAHYLVSPFAIIFQSQQSSLYIEAIEKLWRQGDLYLCTCSSKQIKQLRQSRAHCLCRDKAVIDWDVRLLGSVQGSLRLRTEDEVIEFEDQQCGLIAQNIGREVGDFIIKRSDGLFAYQLATVIDDAWQGITHVVRGADLLQVTPRQIYLQKKLGLPTPHYRHIPLVYDSEGNKLSKQHFAPVLDNRQALENLIVACEHLHIQLNNPLNIDDLLNQAINNWDKKE